MSASVREFARYHGITEEAAALLYAGPQPDDESGAPMPVRLRDVHDTEDAVRQINERDRALADLRAQIIGTRLTLEGVVHANKLAIDRMERGGAFEEDIRQRNAENAAYAYAIGQLNRLIEQ